MTKPLPLMYKGMKRKRRRPDKSRTEPKRQQIIFLTSPDEKAWMDGLSRANRVSRGLVISLALSLLRRELSQKTFKEVEAHMEDLED